MTTLEQALRNLTWKAVPEKAIAVYEKYANQFQMEKDQRGYSPTLNHLAQYMNLTTGKFPGGIPNSPSPLASMLVSGLAGAGLGYGAGLIGEHLLPNNWQRGNLRKTMAVVGGLLGTAPGALWGATNVLANKDFNSNDAFQENFAVPESLKSEIKRSFHKRADLYPGSGLIGPPIDVSQFVNDVWQTPSVANRLQPQEQAAATGLVLGAASSSNRKNTNFVTPMDVARMSAGMGSGYLSGMLVGKALGVMTGMPQSTQDLLKQTGLYAGLIKTIVPLAFGG